LPAKGLANRMVLFMSFMVSSLFPFLLIRKLNVVFASNPQVLAFFPALIYKIFHRCLLVLNVDDLWPEDPADIGMIRSSFMKKFCSLLANIAYKLADAITPISPGYIEVICGKYGVSPRRVYVVRGGVDTTKFKLNMSPKRTSKFMVLYSGAFSVAYDFDQVLKAAKLLEPYGDVEFVLQGGGELLDYVKRRVAEMRLKNVKIIDRILSRGEVAELLSQADALLLPLRDFGRPYLGISSKLYEYQAVGKPIICIAEGQPAEYVKETNSGIVVKPGDYEALARAILKLKENPSLALIMGRNGRKYVEKEASIEAIGLKMKKIFKIIKMKVNSKR
ncbi:MAG: glycosyltransferase family 4 protein, partial [Thermoproteota archaeon]